MTFKALSIATLFAAVSLAISFSTITNASARTSAADPIAIPARINDIKVTFAPAGSPPGSVGAAPSFVAIHATVEFCRDVSADQFVVRVKKYRAYQSIEILDAARLDCRGLARAQDIVLSVPDFENYKPVKILNKYIVDYSR